MTQKSHGPFPATLKPRTAVQIINRRKTTPPMDRLEYDVLQAFDLIEADALSDRTLSGVLQRRLDIETDLQEVQEACAALVEEGELEVVGEKGENKRYRILD